MKVKNMFSSKGNEVANQFVIRDEINSTNWTETFQSYSNIIAKVNCVNGHTFITLDEKYWNYSRTTSKYRSIFLNENTKETDSKIKSGDYQLTNLN